MSSSRLRVAVLGATGVAGHEFLAALALHPLFQVTRLGASERSAGRPYLEAISDTQGKVNWFCRESLDPRLASLPVENASEMKSDGLDLVFSAVEADAARLLEPRFA